MCCATTIHSRRDTPTQTGNGGRQSPLTILRENFPYRHLCTFDKNTDWRERKTTVRTIIRIWEHFKTSCKSSGKCWNALITMWCSLSITKYISKLSDTQSLKIQTINSVSGTLHQAAHLRRRTQHGGRDLQCLGSLWSSLLSNQALVNVWNYTCKKQYKRLLL